MILCIYPRIQRHILHISAIYQSGALVTSHDTKKWHMQISGTCYFGTPLGDVLREKRKTYVYWYPSFYREKLEDPGPFHHLESRNMPFSS